MGQSDSYHLSSGETKPEPKDHRLAPGDRGQDQESAQGTPSHGAPVWKAGVRCQGKPPESTPRPGLQLWGLRDRAGCLPVWLGSRGSREGKPSRGGGGAGGHGDTGTPVSALSVPETSLGISDFWPLPPHNLVR